MRMNLGLNNAYLKMGIVLSTIGAAAIAASWHGVPPMSAARSMHVSTVLFSGGVVALVIGCVVKVLSRMPPTE